MVKIEGKVGPIQNSGKTTNERSGADQRHRHWRMYMEKWSSQN